ncbi:MAG: hypothetical protein A2117_01960 [Candidatus Wildermuthbacteria bacterium GWA2_46_15]|uniref:Uncharacterized protein n=1 Tax=Candidatus Wildermuthbacteria bacterium GWA2_46_15 TaxID=1802443 RepID=A0A1G2QNI6_9BACT|nr:MAG: hypothetical protein A2117_01960 [Candidatus Wildermuthbacteria bacterium GWA2_46_15]
MTIKEKLKSFKEKIRGFLFFLKRFPWTIGERVFPFFVVMIILAVVIGALFFLKFVVLISRQALPVSSELPVLDEPALEKILRNWQSRQRKLEAADGLDYPDLFSPKGE